MNWDWTFNKFFSSDGHEVYLVGCNSLQGTKKCISVNLHKSLFFPSVVAVYSNDKRNAIPIS